MYAPVFACFVGEGRGIALFLLARTESALLCQRGCRSVFREGTICINARIRFARIKSLEMQCI
jgi:hypothetical protein